MKKTIYTLDINNYLPQVKRITFPLFKFYAKKIGADFKVITERKFPDMPITYEKFQIYELAQQDKNDWTFYIDADAIVHPETIDPTLFINKDTVGQMGQDNSNWRFASDRYFQRDGRYIGSCNWFAVFSDLTLEMYKPEEELTLEEMLANITPTRRETEAKRTAEHFIDDYVISRNIAKYGLKHKNLNKLIDELIPGADFFYHQHLVQDKDKAKDLEQTIINWNLANYIKAKVVN